MKRYLFRIITLVCVKMMIPSFLFAGTVFNANAQKITLVYEQVELHKILEEVKRLTSYDFIYKPENIDGGKKVSLDIREENLEPALKKIFDPMGISMRIESQVIMLQKGQQEEISKRVLKGKVLDEDKNPLPGVNVFITGTTIGALTDMNGEFQIGVPGNVTSITFSFIGMKSVEYSLKEVDWSKPVKIIMKNEVATLDEVVVTGMERVERQKMTGSVATVTAKDLRHQGITSIDQILEGMVAGLNSTSVSGAPGTRAQITIRGENNLSGRTEPLWIVDGLPLLSGVPQDNTGDYVGTVMQDGVGNIMPEDIESITILKDASATAIYGARAANGVIVIETKKGFRSKLQFNYSGTYNVAIAPRMKMDFMNSREKLEYEANVLDYVGLNYADNLGRGGRLRRQLYEGKLTPGDYQSSVADLGSRSTNWFKEIFRTAHSQMHNLSLRGGTEEMTYYTSFNFQNKNGILLPNRYSSAGVLVRLDYRPVKNLIIGVDVNASTRKNEDHASAVDPFNYAMFANPYERPYDENGNVKKVLYSYEYYDRGITSKTMYNELYNAVLPSKNQQTSNNFLNNFSIEYDIIQGLKLKANLSLSVDNGKTDVYKSYENTEFLDKEKKGSYAQSTSNDFSYDINVILSYFKSLKKHFINLGFVYNLQEKQYDNTSIYVVGFPNANMDHVSIGSGYQEGAKPGGSFDVTRLVGFVGNLGYTYDNRFLLDASVRSDGSSIYGSNNRWGTFWSVGVGYNIHNEKFMKSVDFIDRLKLRASYGQTGSQNFSAYQAISTYSYYLNDRYYQWMGAYQKALDNPNLEWQKTDKYNLGIEINTFNNCLNFIADFYLEKTSNLLSSLELPLSNGFTSYVENIGKVENRGFELKATGFLIRDTERRLIWTLTGSLAHNKDEIVKLSDALKSEYSKRLLEGGTLPNKVLREGESQNSIYAVRSMGIDPSTGREMFLKQNGEVSYTWDANDRVYCGVSEPKYRGNFSTMFRWRDLSLNLSFAYRLGGQLYNSTLASKVENADKRYNVDERVFTDRWQKPGDETLFKGLNNESSTYATTRFVQDERTLIGQNLYVSYEFLSNPWLQKHLGIQTLTISGDLSDLFYWSTIKQERGLSYPFSRRFSFSLSMRF